MKSILCCSDGSIYSTPVYELSAWASRQTAAEVHVLHMLNAHREQALTSDLTGNIGIDTGDALLEELTQFEENKGRLARLRGKAIVEDARQQLENLGVKKVTTEMRHGALVDQLEELGEGIGLVVIGKRGQAAGQAVHHLGSNLERVLRSSTRPVLVSPKISLPKENFLMAYDGGPSSEKALNFALQSPLLRGMRCRLLRAGRIDADAEWFLQEAAAKLRKVGYEVETELTPGSPTEVIRTAVATHQVQLLLMGAYGHSKLRNFMLGSTTTSLLLHTHVPILMFR